MSAVPPVRVTVPPTEPPADADRAAAWPRLDAVDRAWAGIAYTRVFARIDLPAADRVRDALLGLGRDVPAVGQWVAAGSARARRVADDEWDRWLAHVFVPSGVGCDDPGVDLDALSAINADDPQWTQFRVTAGPDWIGVRMYHSVGDGFTVNAFLAEVLARAAGSPGPAPARHITASARDRVIARAALRYARTGLRAVRDRAELAGGEYVAETADVARGREQVLHVVSEPELPGRLREIRDRHFPGASAATVGMVSVRAAISAELGAPQPGFECLFNTRTDEAGTQGIWGNFSAGVYVRPADDLSPAALGAEVQRVRASGLPELAHASLRMKGRHGDGGNVRMPRPTGRARLTLSYVARHHIDPFVPGLRPGESLVATMTRPNGADSITVQQLEFAGRLQASVAFYPHVWAPERVRAAVAASFADPLGCIERTR